MNFLGKDSSHRQLSRLAELKANNENSKRFFGRDITNVDRRGKKNASIYEKVPVAKVEQKAETRSRARSLYGRKETIQPVMYKEALN